MFDWSEIPQVCIHHKILTLFSLALTIVRRCQGPEPCVHLQSQVEMEMVQTSINRQVMMTPEHQESTPSNLKAQERNLPLMCSEAEESARSPMHMCDGDLMKVIMRR
ncbi:hypothetical protein EV702DRAFT_452998 [Suillus placidus]|uniref:Uncharacterized protein n=1 Tax=Suillus placidus TaxID=48579 RepID=A0A9P6ZRN9_9AGAM|nr:hypothetical protein EV702DRAFT_452998 [Suillus placidus]